MKTKKSLHHTLTKKKILKRKSSRRLARGFFIVVAALCTGSLAVALAATKPSSASLYVQTDAHRPGYRLAGDPTPVPPNPEGTPDQVGTASWYALGLPSPDSLTCASTHFGRGTYLDVKNLRNGKHVTCLVNDYGPEAWTNRAIDLSRGSFRVIDSLSSGTTKVEIRVVSRPTGLNINAAQLLGTLMGYNLCSQTNTMQFCEINKQSSLQLK